MKRRPGNRVRRLGLLFAGMAIASIVLLPIAEACPYMIRLGDNVERLVNTGAVYSTHRQGTIDGYTDYRDSYQWGWNFGGYVRSTYTSTQLKNLEQIMDQQGYQNLNSLQNLNDDSKLCLMQSYIYDAQAAAGPYNVNGAWVPCQLLTIARNWLNQGDTSRFGRVGEVVALADFIVVHEAMAQNGWAAPWYWGIRHSLSGVGIQYFGTNPDFTLHWSNTLHEWWHYTCFIVCWQSGSGGSSDENGPIDAMEVKSTMSLTYQAKLREAEAQLRAVTVSYTSWLPTAVVLDQTYGYLNVYFEIANSRAQFRFGG